MKFMRLGSGRALPAAQLQGVPFDGRSLILNGDKRISFVPELAAGPRGVHSEDPGKDWKRFRKFERGLFEFLSTGPLS